MAVVVNVFSPGNWDPYDSYGLIACRLARHLTELGYYVNAYGHGEVDVVNQTDEIHRITTRSRRGSLGGIVLGYPTTYQKYGAISTAGPRVAITMFESSKIPQGWVEELNRCQAIVVPSRFCYRVFRDCGVTTPIHVVPLGVSETYKFIPRSTNRPYTYLALLDRGKRKGGLTVLQAFLRRFEDRDDVKLILKSRFHEYLPKLEIINSNIEVVDEDLTEDELWKLYGTADVFVNPNLGEGFGLVPREFAATGGVSLATNWGGTHDDIDLWGIPLPYDLIPADWVGVQSLDGQDLGNWALPNSEGVELGMIHAWENREYYWRQAEQISQRTHALYSWQSWARQVSELWEEVDCGYSYAEKSIAA